MKPLDAQSILNNYIKELSFKIETFGEPPYNSVGHGILMGLEEARDLLMRMIEELNNA